MFYLLYTLLGIYGVLLLWMARGFMLTPTFTAGNPKQFLPASIIVCARNEEQYIAACLTSILQQHYDNDQIELILVDDASTDHTLEMAQKILTAGQISFQIIRNTVAIGKKKCITKAIAIAKHELIVSRDADTITQSPNWLRQIAEIQRQENTDLIIGPVAMTESSSFLKALQAIENNVLTVVSAGSAYYGKAFLCSGANLAFTKTLFSKTNGYTSHLHLASGDDVLFLDDAKKIAGTKITFLRAAESVVQTYPVNSVRSLFRQKIRWASKFRYNSSALNLIMAVLVFGVNVSFAYCLFAVFFIGERPLYSLFIILKLCIDIVLLILASTLIKNRHLFWFILPVALVYPIYAVVIALSSLFFKPSWK